MNKEAIDQLALLLQDDDTRMRLTAFLANYVVDYFLDGDDSRFDELATQLNGGMEMVSQNPAMLEDCFEDEGEENAEG